MNDSQKTLLKRLDELSVRLGDTKSKAFPLWVNLRQMIQSLQNFIHLEYYHNPTDEQKKSGKVYEEQMEKLKKHIKKNPGLTREEIQKLIYGTN